VSLQQGSNKERQTFPPALQDIAELVIEVPHQEPSNKAENSLPKHRRDGLLDLRLRGGESADEVGGSDSGGDKDACEEDLVMEWVWVGDAARRRDGSKRKENKRREGRRRSAMRTREGMKLETSLVSERRKEGLDWDLR